MANTELKVDNGGCTGCCELCERRGGGTAVETLGGRRILLVGGRTKQVRHLRSLVESWGGCLAHHDGGLHDGIARLEHALEQADAVMCPIGCVSHDACKRLKRHCKRYAKPMLMVRGQGLTSFARELLALAA